MHLICFICLVGVQLLRGGMGELHAPMMEAFWPAWQYGMSKEGGAADPEEVTLMAPSAIRFNIPLKFDQPMAASNDSARRMCRHSECGPHWTSLPAGDAASVCG